MKLEKLTASLNNKLKKKKAQSFKSVSTETPVQFLANPRGFCDGRSGTETGFSPST
jgi:hypothetical protein